MARFLAVVLVAVVIAEAAIAEQTVTRKSGGSIRTPLSENTIVNEKSSLQREWITVHDSAMPADLIGTIGVKTIYKPETSYSRGEYRYEAEYTLATSEALSAIEVCFLTFDIWGNYNQNLSTTEIIDIPATKGTDFKA